MSPSLNRVYKGHYLFLFKFIRRNKDDNLIDEFRKNIFDYQTLLVWLIIVEKRQKVPVRGVLLTKTFQI